ncbi:GumC domain-containing protein [Hymenobacter siberiensis]|uniref:hypothetical protein n=1 Tax=Hymenobacter siberiensis TaxID=2848396 RepID=UPI001C1E494D|nr:hypothetical protein [Hymenobacter siberiensis]MBU6121957.1 hypothetical protein [Hymenobacter siberiensis]
MSPTDILRLLLKNWKLLLAVPLALGGSLFYFTRHEAKSYASETTIYTGIASGYSLTGNSESDYFRTSNAFDNLLSLIKSRETKEHAACYLLASHLQLKELDANQLSWASLSRMRALLPAALRRQLTGPTLAATQRNVTAYASANDTNELYRLLNSHDPVYSVEALGKVNATRINSSDLIKLELETEDAAICRATLALTTQVFLAEYRSLRMSQTAVVIRYYKVEAEKALKRLNDAEEKFLVFNRDNNIINYYEQTKYIAGEREYLYSDINKIEMQYAGALAALAAVDKKLAGRGASLLSSAELLRQRKHLENLNTEIANQQLFARQQETDAAPRTQQLQVQAAETVLAIRTTLNDHYAQLNSVEGIPSKGLLDEWVKNMLEATENKAKLEVMGRRKGEFMAEYHKMAPLGAMLKRIEREIDLTQKTYFALFTSLNDSKASQQNNELTTNLKIVAPPFLPSQARGGKRLVLVAGGAFGGFFFVAATLLGMGLLDKSLRMPSVAQAQTGLPVLGLLPAHPIHPFKKTKKPAKAPKPRDHSYEHAAAEHLARQVLRRVSAAPARPFVAGVLSPLRQEGKTTVVQSLAQSCNAGGLPTLALYPEGTDAGPANDYTRYYSPAQATLHRWNLAELTQPRAADVQLVLIEFPALLEATYPVTLLPELSLVLLTLKASRSWKLTDQQAVADLRAATAAPVEIVLCGVARYDSTDLVIPAAKEA